MIRLISAIDQKRGIAKGGVLPWHIPDDQQYFYEQTIQHGGIVLMGKHTFESIGKPLKDRRNYVISRHGHKAEGVEFIQDFDRFFLEQQGQDVWIIGGQSLFEQGIIIADEIYLTHVEADFGCDQFFPEYEHVYELSQSSDLHTQNGFIFTYKVYKKL